MKINSYKALLLIFCLILGMVACSASPEHFEYQPENESKPGPGLFSGEKGEFIIFRSPERTDLEEDPTRELQKGEKTE
jgi:hypothetical protein